MKPTLLVLAAGMGSRFGGLKQIEPMGPHGETLLDYSVFDAVRAGFGKVVFVIRPDFAEEFKNKVGRRFQAVIEVDYAFQTLDGLPSPFVPPQGRTKPWGTGHAVLAAKAVVRENFCVINADDFYGREAYLKIAHHLQALPKTADNSLSLSGVMVGYRLRQTLSAYGTVSRGLCQLDHEGHLRSVQELTKIQATDSGAENRVDGQPTQTLTGEEIVSLNFWGLTPDFFPKLEALLAKFLEKNGQPLTGEFYLPCAIDHLVARHEAQIRVLTTESPWFGVTYREDQPTVQASLRELTARHEYPGSLFGS